MFWRKNNKDDFTNIIGLTNTGDIRFSKSGDMFLTISQALLCLFLCVGSICGYASCFGAQFDLAKILIILTAASFIIAYARNLKTNWLKNLIYIGFLFLFGFFIMRYFRYVNSGYHALINMTYASLENYLEIPALVYYEELIENSYSTITMFLIFLGIFELLLFHMWIGERIHLMSLFLVSFAPYLVPLFINLFPEELYLTCLLTAYIALIFICLGCHVNSHPKKQKDYMVFTKKNPWSSSIKGFSYGANGVNYLMTTILAFAMSIVIIIMVSFVTPRASFQNNLRTSKMKTAVTDEVKYFVTFGLSGYFNRYQSTGGLNDGQLGGVYSVRPDYETDLTVTFVPLTYEPLYLRGFVGIGYTDRQWYDIDSLFENNLINDLAYSILGNEICLNNEFNYLKQINFGRKPYLITINNVRANVKYDYTPYYVDTTTYPSAGRHISDAFLYGKTRDYPFYYYMSIADNNTYLQKNPDMAAYMQVPSETRDDILAFLIENNLCTKYISTDGSYKNYSAAETTLIINEISDCLTNDFVYSMNPGITPRKETFVGHFLDEKKGFCAHFATTATLMLRTLGIPARYVEGYVVTSEDLAEGEILTNINAADYVDTSLVETNLSVVRAEIGDDKAHAWVEYYTPEFGWRPFEATTASMEQSVNSDFWSSLYGLFSESEKQASAADITNTNISSGNLSTFLYRLFLITLAVIILLFVAYYSYRLIKQYRSYHRNRMNINVRNFYKIICAKVSRKHPEFAYLISYKLQFEFLKEHYKLSDSFNDKNTDKLCKILEQTAFSNVEITGTEFVFAMKLLRLLRKNIAFRF